MKTNSNINIAWHKKALIIFSVFLLALLLMINPLSVEQFFSADHKIGFGSFYLLLILTIFLSFTILLCILSVILINKQKMKIPNITINFSMMIFSFIFIIFVIEVLFRTILSSMVPVNLYSFNKFFGMIWHKPNLVVNLKTSEYNVQFRTNRVGLRGDKELEEKANNEFRIMIFGDSFIQAAQVNIEKTMCYLLEEKLNSLNTVKKYRVFNLGTSGCDTEYQRKFIEKNIHLFNTDILFLFSYIGNDIITESVFRENNKSKINKILSSFIDNSRRYSFLLTFIYERINQENVYPLGRPCQPFDGFPKERSANIFYKESNSKIEEAYSKLWNELAEIKAICSKSNIKLIVFLIPTKEQVDPIKLKEVLNFFKIDPSALDLTKPQKLISQFLINNQIDYVDLLDTLRTASNYRDVYFDLDSHWNEHGNSVVAEKLFNDIKANKYF